jgi:hypothetical protein
MNRLSSLTLRSGSRTFARRYLLPQTTTNGYLIARHNASLPPTSSTPTPGSTAPSSTPLQSNTPLSSSYSSPNPSPNPPKRRLSPGTLTLLLAKYTAFLIGSAGVGVLLIGAGVFIHDAFTYSEKHLDRVPVSPLALNPKLGGPKGLPIAEVSLEDEENDGKCACTGRVVYANVDIMLCSV